MKHETIKTKAQAIWKCLTDSEKQGIRFGLFPGDIMAQICVDNLDPHEISVALINCANKEN